MVGNLQEEVPVSDSVSRPSRLSGTLGRFRRLGLSLGLGDLVHRRRRLLGVDDLKDVSAHAPAVRVHLDDLVLGHHLVLEWPTGAAAQLRDDDVAVAQQVNIEVDVVDGLARDIDLGDVGR